MIHGRPQAPVVVILERYEAKWLKYAFFRFARSAENLSHAVHRTGLRLECEFDKTAISKRMLHLQQAARNRYRLQFCFRAPAIF